jgi:hypothetical protein
MSIPPEIIRLLEREIEGISHGSVTLTVHLRDGCYRFSVGWEQSLLPGAPAGVLRDRGKIKA